MANTQTVGELVYKISGDMENLKAELAKAESGINDLSKEATKGSSDVSKLNNTLDSLNKKAKELKATMNSSVIGSEQFKKASAELEKVNEQIKKADKSVDGFGGQIKKLIGALGLAYLAKLVIDFGKAAVQAYANAQQSLIQYNNAQQNVAGSTKEQINDLNEYIGLLEEKTSVDDKTIRQAAQILAQDQIKIENQKKILAGIVDIAVANSKANGGEIDTQGTAVAVGRAFATGDLGGLTRQNIVGIDEATAKAFKLGNEAERTAIMMKLLADNGKGAGEALGASFQGSINRARDTVEDLQVAIGRGLSTAFSVFAAGLGDTTGGLKIATDGTNKLGTAFVFLAGLVNFVINVLKLMGISLAQTGLGLFNLAKISYGFGKDVVGIFSKVKEAITSIGSAMVKVLTGDFKGAVDNIKNGFDFSGTFDNSKKALDEATASTGKLQNAFNKTTKDIAANVQTMANAKQVYKDVTAENEKLTQAKDAQKKATERAIQATEEEKKSIQTLRDKVLDLKNKTDELVQSLGDKLVEATKKFSEEVNKLATEGTKDLASIVVKAEEDIADLKKKLAEEQAKSSDDQNANEIKSLNEQIAQKQKILTSYAGFQSALSKEVAKVQADIDANSAASLANTDPTKQANFDAKAEGLALQLEALKNFETLDKQVTEARKLAGDDEFLQAQINTFAKIQLATNLFIEETTKLREKKAIAIEVEKSVTDFYREQTALRQKTLDSFATSSIATMRRIGDEAKSALSALNSLRSAGAQIDAPINPISTPGISGSSTSSSTSNTTNNKNVSNQITINAQVAGSADANQIAKDLAWQLSHK